MGEGDSTAGRRWSDRHPQVLDLKSFPDLEAALRATVVGTIPEEVVLVLDVAGGAVPVAVERLPGVSGLPAPRVRSRVEAVVADWHAERMALQERATIGERFMAFAEEMAMARSAREAHDAIVEAAPAIAGGHRAVLLMAGESDPPVRVLAPTLLRREDDSCTIPPQLRRLLLAMEAASYAVVPVGQKAVLVVSERREESTYAPRQWYLLRTMARIAEAALERLARHG